MPGARTAGSWGWTYEGEEVRTRPSATRRTSGPGQRMASAALPGERRAVDYKVRLVTTKPNYGGRGGGSSARSCADGGPPRRVAKLYLPSGASLLGAAKPTD